MSKDYRWLILIILLIVQWLHINAQYLVKISIILFFPKLDFNIQCQWLIFIAQYFNERLIMFTVWSNVKFNCWMISAVQSLIQCLILLLNDYWLYIDDHCPIYC